MNKGTVFVICLGMMVSSCALPASDDGAENGNVGEIRQPLDEGTYRYTVLRDDVMDWTADDPDGNVTITYPGFYVPEIASRLQVQTGGGTGNLDLTVWFQDTGGFECLSANSGTEERCRYADPAAGHWRASLQLWDPIEGVQFRESYALPVAYEVQEFEFELEQDAWQSLGSFPVAPGSQFSVELGLTASNPDIYVRWDADPDLDHWDCRPFAGRFGEEVCDLSVPDGVAAAHVSVHNNSKRRVRETYDVTVISAEVL